MPHGLFRLLDTLLTPSLVYEMPLSLLKHLVLPAEFYF